MEKVNEHHEKGAEELLFPEDQKVSLQHPQKSSSRRVQFAGTNFTTAVDNIQLFSQQMKVTAQMVPFAFYVIKQ